MESPLIFPLYLEDILLPPNSRVTVKEISSPLILPSSILASLGLPWRPGIETVPLTLSPSTVSLRVLLRGSPPLRPGVLQDQLPEASAPYAAMPDEMARKAMTGRRLLRMRCIVLVCELVLNAPRPRGPASCEIPGRADKLMTPVGRGGYRG